MPIALNDFLLATTALWVTYLACLAFVRSPLGAACTAVREDLTLARALGIRVGLARLAAFTVGAFFAGIAGALFASLSNFIGPDSFSVAAAGFQLVVMVIVGGKGTLWGPILGAALLTALQGGATTPASDPTMTSWSTRCGIRSRPSRSTPTT